MRLLVPKEKYIEQSTLKLGDSMWGFKEKNIEKTLEQNEWVKSARSKTQLVDGSTYTSGGIQTNWIRGKRWNTSVLF